MNDSACFPQDVPALRVRCGVGRGELAAAYELVYRSYCARGYVPPHPGGIVYQPTFGLPSSRTLIAASPSREPVGTLSIVGDNPWGFEAETTFPEEVRTLRRQGRRLAELTCLAIDPVEGFEPRCVFFALTKFMIHYVMWRGYDELLLAIHPRHYRFYWRFFRAYPLGPTRPHSFANDNPALACAIDLRTLRQNGDPELFRRYFARPVPVEAFLRPAIRPEDHHYFCRRSGAEFIPDVDVPPPRAREAA